MLALALALALYVRTTSERYACAEQGIKSDSCSAGIEDAAEAFRPLRRNGIMAAGRALIVQLRTYDMFFFHSLGALKKARERDWISELLTII